MVIGFSTTFAISAITTKGTWGYMYLLKVIPERCFVHQFYCTCNWGHQKIILSFLQQFIYILFFVKTAHPKYYIFFFFQNQHYVHLKEWSKLFWTLRMSDNLPERVQILCHAHIICITVLENRIICCQIFCDLLLKSANNCKKKLVHTTWNRQIPQ
jgi:hypothetical protein